MIQETQEQTRPEQINQELLAFFKLLADSSRLKIVGMLAQKAYTVEEISSALGLNESAASHHLSKLVYAGLVAAAPEDGSYRYSLQAQVLHAMAQRIQSKGSPARFSEDTDLDAFERKVLSAFTDDEGRIISLPVQEKKLLVMLRYAAKAFEPGERYTEKQVNEILLRFNDDTASLRRLLVDHRLMDRQSAGSAYWLKEQA